MTMLEPIGRDMYRADMRGESAGKRIPALHEVAHGAEALQKEVAEVLELAVRLESALLGPTPIADGASKTGPGGAGAIFALGRTIESTREDARAATRALNRLVAEVGQ